MSVLTTNGDYQTSFNSDPYAPSAPPLEALEQAPVTPVAYERFANEAPATKWNLKAYAFTKIDAAESALNARIPKFGPQKAYDDFCDYIQAAMAKTPEQAQRAKEYNDWLQSNGKGPWYEKVAIFLAKLPLKIARNLCDLIVNFVKLAIAAPTYIVMHPMKTMLKLAKILIELLQPETWTKIGAGMMGSSAATAAVTGGFSAITFAIGAALAFAGISIGTLKTALVADKGMKGKATYDYFLNQTMQMTETFATSFCLVLTLEAIQQVIRGFQKLDNHVKNSNARYHSKQAHLRTQSKEFLDNHPELPKGGEVSYSRDSFKVQWHHSKFPNGAPNIPGTTHYVVDVHTGNDVSGAWVTHWTREGFQTEYVTTITPIYTPHDVIKVGLQGWTAPTAIPLGAAPRMGDAVMAHMGAVETIRIPTQAGVIKAPPVRQKTEEEKANRERARRIQRSYYSSSGPNVVDVAVGTIYAIGNILSICSRPPRERTHRGPVYRRRHCH